MRLGIENCAQVDRLELVDTGPSSGSQSRPRLELGLMVAAGSAWPVADFRPVDAPLTSLACALLDTNSCETDGPVSDADVALLRAFLMRGARSTSTTTARLLPRLYAPPDLATRPSTAGAAMDFHVTAVEHPLVSVSGVPATANIVYPNASLAPAREAIVDRLVRSVLAPTVLPVTPNALHMIPLKIRRSS